MFSFFKKSFGYLKGRGGELPKVRTSLKITGRSSPLLPLLQTDVKDGPVFSPILKKEFSRSLRLHIRKSWEESVRAGEEWFFFFFFLISTSLFFYPGCQRNLWEGRGGRKRERPNFETFAGRNFFFSSPFLFPVWRKLDFCSFLADERHYLLLSFPPLL